MTPAGPNRGVCVSCHLTSGADARQSCRSRPAFDRIEPAGLTVCAIGASFGMRFIETPVFSKRKMELLLEQGRRTPDGPAQAFHRVATQNPEAVADALRA